MKTREQLEATGNKILNSVRTELYLSMRFMGPALGSLGFAMDLSTRTVGTDAVYIRFNPTYLLQTYIERPEILNRTYMHMLMHCLFRHMFSAKQHEDAQLWDLCCDIAVESVVDSMDYPTILRVTSDFRQEWYEKLEKEVSVLTAEKLYQYFMLRKRDPYLEESLRQEFLLCDHSFWQRMEKEPPQEQNKNQPPVPQENPQMDSDQQENAGEKTSDATPLGKTDPKEDEWKEHAKRIESDMETYAKDAAADAGKLAWMLKLSSRERKSYKEFLKRFAVVREEVSVDMDSFDYGFYMYGLQHYGNMPLIEHLEYQEMNRMEELVIAIDTSGSCDGETVRRFLGETYSILSEKENFFHKMKVYLIQCDCCIQDVKVIHSEEEWKEYSKNITIQGRGGTDFRPVFRYVKEQQEKKEIRSLKALIYFTDGDGIYPGSKPDYETAFVFLHKTEKMELVPPWAIRLVAEQEGVRYRT